MAINKVVKNAAEAIQGIDNDMTLMFGGFGRASGE